MAVVIATTSSAIPTTYALQSKVARTANGNLWATFTDTGYQFKFYYSTDNGATWTLGTTQLASFASTTNDPSHSIFIDSNDYLHLAYTRPSDGVLAYRRGTPNAGRTDWTFSGETTGQSVLTVADVVAHPEGTGWKAHIVAARGSGSPITPIYTPVTITSGGTITFGTVVELENSTPSHAVPSIDFYHNGDGKTATATPHLFVCWSTGATGAGEGIKFAKATYSGGTWTWGATREIDTTRKAQSDQVLRCMYDGTRVVIAGAILDASANVDLMIYERDVADTTTTTRLVVDNMGTSALTQGSVARDSSANLYFIGNAGASGMVYRKWTRATTTLDGAVTIDATSGRWASPQRGYSTGRIDLIYTDEGANPDAVTYEFISTNVAPNAPTGLTPSGGTVIDRTITQQFQWTFSDPDSGDSQSKYDLRYRLIGAGSWTDILNQTTTNTYHDFTANFFAAGDYEWQVRTYDAQGVVGPYSSSALYTAAAPPVAPSITDPINNQVLATNSHTVLWSATNQDSYQVRTVADNAGAPDTATVYTDTGEVLSASARSRSVSFAVNNRFEHVQVRVKYQTLWSTWASVRVQVSYTPPGVPTFTLTANNTAGTLAVAITNPAPVGGEPTVASNDVYVNDGAGEERKVTGVAPSGTFTYRTPVSGRNYTSFVRVVAHGSNGTTRSS